MSQDKFNSIIDVPALTEEQKATLKLLTELKSQFIDTASGVIKLNEALFGANSSKTFAQSAKAVTDGLDQINNTQKKVVDTEAKAAAQREKQMNAYLVQLSKEQAERDKADAKEAVNAQKRLDRIAKEQAALDAAAAKRAAKLNSDDPRFSKTQYADSNGLFELDTKTISDGEIQGINAKKEALLQEAAALRSVVDAQSTATAAKQKSVGVTVQENSTLLDAVNDNIRLKAELKSVEAQIKATSGADAQLIIQQKALQAEIQKNTTTIGQITKQETAAAGSADQLNARLAQLRAGYNALSKEERENVEVGGRFLDEIKVLDKQTKEIAESQGIYNKSVGDYENSIKRAISQYVPFGNQIVQGIDGLKSATQTIDQTGSTLTKLGLTFASFTVTGFAIAIATASYYLNQFQGTADKVDISLAGIKARVGSLGKTIVDSVSADSSKPSKLDTFLAGTKLTLTAIFPFLNSLKDSTDEASKSGEAAAIAAKKYEDLNTTLSAQTKILQGQVNVLRAQSRDRLQGSQDQIDLLNKADDAEKKVIANQTTLGNAAIRLGVQVGNIYNTITKDQVDSLNKGDISLATSLFRQSKFTKDGYELYKEGLSQKQDALNSSNALDERIQAQRNNLLLKQDKKTGDELLKQRKESLQNQINAAKDAAATQKSIQGDNNNPENVRYAALQALLAKEDQIADLEAKKAKLSSKDLEGIDKAAKAQKLLNRQQYDIEYQKIIADDYEKQKALADKYFKELQSRTDSYSAEQLAELAKNLSDQEVILSERYAKGIINRKTYEQEKLKLQKEYNQLSDQEQLRALETQLAQEAFAGKDITNTLKAINALKVKIAKKAADETIKGNEDQGKQGGLSDNQKLEIQTAETVQDKLAEIYQKQADARLALIEIQKKAIQDQAQTEIDAENRSLDSSKAKADKIALINAKSAAKQKLLDDEANKQKLAQAKFERALSIVKIIEATAVAILEQGAITPTAIAAGIVGAAELALVLATPLPKFADGGTHKGGHMIAGELGTELMIDPSGRLGLTPNKATFMDAPAGTQIIDHAKTMKILANPERVQYVGGQQIDLSELVGVNREMLKEMRNQPRQRRQSDRSYRDWSKTFRDYIN